MLRRKGHSLKVQLSTNYDEVCRLQNNSHYEAIFFSCASYLSIRETAKCVRQVKKTLKQSVPIFLGGSNIEEISQGVDLSCFDLVTNSLSAVNDYVSNKKKRELALDAGALIQ
jgi:heptaprenylglyceryl phosphate synthase